MQVFTEFIKSDLTEDQTLPVLRELLPVLLNILGTPEVNHSVSMRPFVTSVLFSSHTMRQPEPGLFQSSANVLPPFSWSRINIPNPRKKRRQQCFLSG